ncbi:CWC21 [Candida theae]|uniref:CWC21 n=1 Tax=Candida theae TaxID=1198502 RepID=A0AAD5G0X6_9ASCO|nr:CWC21 [Candida theae]KAI5967473.1 CWC21 [Candida theae]
MSSNKGSGRSGHIEKNIIAKKGSSKLFYASRQQQIQDELLRKRIAKNEESTKNARSSIEKHNELRKVQVACTELEEDLESKGVSAEEIQAAVNKLKMKLLNKKEKENDTKDQVYNYKPRFSSK